MVHVEPPLPEAGTVDFDYISLEIMTMKRRSVAAFTLIELLVVVAIIALLISILLPSLNRARDQAKQVVCLSQLKQMGLAFVMYTDDWDDYMPLARNFSNSAKWSGILRPYLINDGMIESADMSVNVGEIFACPSNPYRYGLVQRYLLNYVYNGWSLVKYPFIPKKVDSLDNPAERIIIGDGWLGGFATHGPSWTPWYYSIGVDWYIIAPVGGLVEPHVSHWNTIAMIHVGNQGNLAWADGHASAATSTAVNDRFEDWIGENE